MVKDDRTNENERLWKISDRRVDRLYQEYAKMGFLVMINRRNHTGPDLIVISTSEGKVVKIIESTNYARLTREGKPEYISQDKMLRYISSLTYFNRIPGVKLEIIISFRENLHSAWFKKLTESSITVVIVGRQD